MALRTKRDRGFPELPITLSATPAPQLPSRVFSWSCSGGMPIRLNVLPTILDKPRESTARLLAIFSSEDVFLEDTLDQARGQLQGLVDHLPAIDCNGNAASSLPEGACRVYQRSGATVATSCLSNLLHGGGMDLPKKLSTKARKNDAEIIIEAANFASTREAMRSNRCSERMYSSRTLMDRCGPFPWRLREFRSAARSSGSAKSPAVRKTTPS